MDLKSQRKYRVFMDESYIHENQEGKSKEKWRYWELRGKFGMVYAYSTEYLGVQVKAGIIGERTRRAHRDWKVIQDADDLVVFKVPNVQLDEAAGIIRARRRRVISPAQREKMVMRLESYRKNPPRNEAQARILNEESKLAPR